MFYFCNKDHKYDSIVLFAEKFVGSMRVRFLLGKHPCRDFANEEFRDGAWVVFGSRKNLKPIYDIISPLVPHKFDCFKRDAENLLRFGNVTTTEFNLLTLVYKYGRSSDNTLEKLISNSLHRMTHGSKVDAGQFLEFFDVLKKEQNPYNQGLWDAYRGTQAYWEMDKISQRRMHEKYRSFCDKFKHIFVK